MKLMSPHEKATLIALLEKMPTTTPCNVCIHYDAGLCRDAGQKIPDDIKDIGCEDWKFDKASVPF